jgi:hypothetical protein
VEWWFVAGIAGRTIPSSIITLHSSPVETRVAITCRFSCSSQAPNSVSVAAVHLLGLVEQYEVAVWPQPSHDGNGDPQLLRGAHAVPRLAEIGQLATPRRTGQVCGRLAHLRAA